MESARSSAAPRRKKKKTFTKQNLITVAVVALLCLLLDILLWNVLLARSGGKYVIASWPEHHYVIGDDPVIPVDPTSEKTSDDPAQPSESSSEAPGEDPSRYTYEAQGFEVDLREYEQYMNPETEEYLFLVNADHPLTASDTPDDLVSVVNTRKDGRDTQKLREYAEKALEALFKEAEAEGMLYSNDGIRLSVTSAYRSYNSQKWIFEDYVQETMDSNPSLSRAEAEELVIAYSSRPGTSEHQSGLCLDMHNYPAASSSNGMREQFAASEAGQWLVKNCAKFGYILRYPDGKSDKMCGVGYESWHFRYVGRYHAVKIMESGLCLEEYMASIGRA